MKRTAALLLALILALTMGACGKKEPLPPEGMENLPPEAMEYLNPEAMEPPMPPFTMFQNIEPTVIYEENGIQVTADRIEMEGDGRRSGYLHLYLQVTNNSGNTIVAFVGDMDYNCMTVNGISVPYRSDNLGVNNGESQSIEVTMEVRELLDRQIRDLEEIAFPLSLNMNADEGMNIQYTDVLRIPIKGAEGYAMSDEVEQREAAGKMFHETFLTESDVSMDGDVHLSKVRIYNTGSVWRLHMNYENAADQYRNVHFTGQGFDNVTLEPAINDRDHLLPGAKGVLSKELTFMHTGNHADLFTNDQAKSFVFYMITEDPVTDQVLSKEKISIPLPGKQEFTMDQGETLYEDNGIRVAWLGSAPEEGYGHALCLSISNTLDQTVVTGMFDIYHGDQEVRVDSSQRVIEPGATAFMQVLLADDLLQENGITDPDQLKDLTIRFPVYTTDEMLPDQYRISRGEADLLCQVEINP